MRTSYIVDTDSDPPYHDYDLSVSVPNIGWWNLHGALGGLPLFSNLLVDNGTWIVGPSLPTAEEFGYSSRPRKFCGSQLNSTHTMVTGGQVGPSGSSLSDVWLYDWSSGQWKVGQNMTKPRRDHLCTSIGGGRVVVAEGTGLYGQDLIDIEVFDPAAEGGLGGWYSMGDLPEDYDYGVGYQGLLYNGKYLIYLVNRNIWLSDESFASWTKLEEIELGSRCGYNCDQRAAMIPEDFFFKKKSSSQ